MVAAQCPNIYFDTSSSNRWMRCEPYDIDLPACSAGRWMWPDRNRLLFGTDSSWFPRGWVRKVFDTQVEALVASGVDAEAARSILGR